MRRIVSVSVIAALAAALSACGGGSSYTGLSKADFVKQAEAICKDGNDKVTNFASKFGANPTLAQVKSAYNDSLLPVYEDELDALRKLKPPKDDRDAIKAMLDDLSTGTDQARTAIAQAKTQADFQKLAEPAGLKKASAEAKAYGLTVCGQE